jgi:hypothetical protein
MNNHLEPVKFLLKSKTILGLIVAALPDLLSFVSQAESSGLIPDEYAPVVRSVGLVLALIGRWTAKLPLSLKPQ